MTRLEIDLLEYTHTREAEMEAAIERYGLAGALSTQRDPFETIANLRAIVAGQPLPVRGAE